MTSALITTVNDIIITIYETNSVFNQLNNPIDYGHTGLFYTY